MKRKWQCQQQTPRTQETKYEKRSATGTTSSWAAIMTLQSGTSLMVWTPMGTTSSFLGKQGARGRWKGRCRCKAPAPTTSTGEARERETRVARGKGREREISTNLFGRQTKGFRSNWVSRKRMVLSTETETQINDLLSQGKIPDANPFSNWISVDIQIDDEVDEGKDLPVTPPTEWTNGSAERVIRANDTIRSPTRFRFTFSFIQLIPVGRSGWENGVFLLEFFFFFFFQR